ncbi:MAG TPA: EAL domain-containing protein [Solirubrobacteraceae bacterium]|nr:EAL domain-containing protein [Solirubrobacteraceae bacterium]
MSALPVTGPGEATCPSRTAFALSPTDDAGLLRHVPAALYSAGFGPEGRWHFVSSQIEGILGYRPEEWCADPLLWRNRLHPDDAERVLDGEHVRNLADDGCGANEYRLLHRDGRVVWVRDDALLVRHADGRLRWHGVLTDITQRKRTEETLQRAAAQHAALAALGEHALEGASATELAQEALSAAIELLGLDRGGVIALDRERTCFTFLASHGMPSETLGPLPFDPNTQPGYAIDHGKVVVSDWETETRFRPTAPLVLTSTHSGMSIVIEGRRGPFGVLGVHCDQAREFSSMDIDFVQALANVLGDAFERQRTEDDIRHRALHDSLTGLPNRTLFMDRLAHALAHLSRRGTSAAVLLLNLDRFKLINESLGHAVGDDLLAAAAPRLRQMLRASDTIARFGADEFGILLEDIAGEQDAVEMAQRISGAFNRPFALDGTEHFVSVSIGISLAGGGERAEDLVRDADAAVHRAKDRGRARYELFDATLRGRAIRRLRVENDLRRALERDELTLEFQPIVELDAHLVTGVEALLRWDHPQRGRVPPLEFIPIAEENGLIEPLGRWVLDRACRQAADWCASRPEGPPISVAVNLSAAQFENPALVESVAAALRGARLEPSRLALEITESVVMGQSEALFDTLAELKALGVSLILDDFGTGYSSLSYLTRLPLDVLKVDRSFIDGLGLEPRDTAVTEAIVAMSDALSLRVTGEGVETERQLGELRRLGVHAVQGFLFSRPVAAERITEILAAGQPWVRRLLP